MEYCSAIKTTIMNKAIKTVLLSNNELLKCTLSWIMTKISRRKEYIPYDYMHMKSWTR